MASLNRTLKYYFLKLKRLKGDPPLLARGVALGTFIGITPTIPLHNILIIGLSFPLRASKISSLLSSVLVSNPATFFFQYFFSWYIGDMLLPGRLSSDKLTELISLISSEAGFMEIVQEFGKLGFAAVSVIVLGGFILAIPFTVFAYIISLNFFKQIEKKRAERIVRQKAREQLIGHKKNTEAS